MMVEAYRRTAEPVGFWDTLSRSEFVQTSSVEYFLEHLLYSM
jgi:hypothetical protein